MGGGRGGLRGSAEVPGYEASPHFRVMAAIGLVGVFVLVVGGVLFNHFQPVTGASGASVKIAAQVYDPQSHTVGGHAQDVFTTREIPAAVVDWQRVPAGMQVASGWFDTNGFQIAAQGPSPAGRMGRVLPLTDAGPIPQDTYVFAAGRWQDGRIVEVLGQIQVRVGGS